MPHTAKGLAFRGRHSGAGLAALEGLVGIRPESVLREESFSDVRKEMAERLKPRREYVAIIVPGRKPEHLFFTANTPEENLVAARVKNKLRANPAAKAVVSNRCVGAMRNYPEVGEVTPKEAPEEKSLTPVQKQVLDQLARAEGGLVYTGQLKRTAGSLCRRGLAFGEKDGRYFISASGREQWRAG